MPCRRHHPAPAQALGLAVVYQHPSVLEDLTVTENLVLSMPAGRRPSMSDAAGWARERLAVVGARIDPRSRVGELSVAEHQLLEIARALALEAQVVILDEPTKSLTAAESERLFERIVDIRASGAAVVYISHRLPEVKRIADRLTVLRDGEGRGTFDANAVSEADILRLIVGRSIDRVFPPRADEALIGDVAPLLVVEGLTGSRFHDVDLVVRPGEIVGLAGVEGNGQRELLRALGGMSRVTGGTVRVAGSPVALGDPRDALDAGIVHLPGDRHREGLFLPLNVRENLSLQSLADVSRRLLVRRDRETQVALREVRADVHPHAQRRDVGVVPVGRQPAEGAPRSIDACLAHGAARRRADARRGRRRAVEIYRILRDAAIDGRAVVVLSSDAVELQGLCDRVLVFSRGTVVRELVGDAATEEAITEAALTATSQRAAVTEGVDQRLGSVAWPTGDYAPSAILALLIVLLALYTGSVNGRFFTDLNLQGMLLLASALVFVSIGQQVVLLVGGIDLSVGPLTGLVVICLSTIVGPGAGPIEIVAGLGESRSSWASPWASSTASWCATSTSRRCSPPSPPSSCSRASRSCCVPSRRASSSAPSRTCSRSRSVHCPSRSWSRPPRRSSASGLSVGRAAAWRCGRSGRMRRVPIASGSG